MRGIAEKILTNLDDESSKYRELRRNADAVRKKIYEPEGVLQILIDVSRNYFLQPQMRPM